jgi:CRISPR/Cas system-associated protein Cas5 (RAMP superfamily)
MTTPMTSTDMTALLQADITKAIAERRTYTVPPASTAQGWVMTAMLSSSWPAISTMIMARKSARIIA